MNMHEILIVEDDINSAQLIVRILEKEGYRAAHAPNAGQGLEMLNQTAYDLLIIDMVMPGMDGLSLLKRVKNRRPDLLTVMVTAYGSIGTAVSALKFGADDFLEKPLIPEKLLLVVRKLFEELRMKNEINSLKSHLAKYYYSGKIIGEHPKMQHLFRMIESVARTDSAVLVTGETGTGKDLVCRAIHHHSHRKDQPFVAINCAAVPENLIESELFGYERHAFSGADKPKAGKLEQAQGGTVFLDEVGDMPKPVQAKLLRALNDKQIDRLGSRTYSPVSLDIRIICATNKDLPRLIAAGEFRMDLFYRINVVNIVVPPLRERREDIPLLVDFFLKRITEKKGGKTNPVVTDHAMSLMMAHSWPGNIRELENIIERALILNPGPVIEQMPFSPKMNFSATAPRTVASPPDTALSLKEVTRQSLVRIEREYLQAVLKKFNGSIKDTARQAGVDVRTIHRKMKKLGLDKWDYKHTT